MIRADRKKWYLLGSPAELARPATSIATLRCEIAVGKAASKLTDALPAIKGKEVTVSSRMLRSLRLLHNRQLTVLVHPPQPPGAIIGRAASALRTTGSARNPQD